MRASDPFPQTKYRNHFSHKRTPGARICRADFPVCRLGGFPAARSFARQHASESVRLLVIGNPELESSAECSPISAFQLFSVLAFPRCLPPIRIDSCKSVSPCASVKKCCHAGLFPVSFPTVSEWLIRLLSYGCAVSSVVEHYLDTVGVRGSKPLPRTIFFKLNKAVSPGPRNAPTRSAPSDPKAWNHSGQAFRSQQISPQAEIGPTRRRKIQMRHG